MKFSYSWLQSYFEAPLPEPEKLGELLTFAGFELEGMEKQGTNSILDLKVLPDRACYALSYRGMAYDIAAITDLPKKTVEFSQPPVTTVRTLTVKVEAPDLCTRYMARAIENVNQKEMPWVRGYLEAVGQRLINPVVDGANLVMFDRGQPLHAFDADKVVGGITVRMARKGEKIVTLDNREVALDESILVIADDEAPLAIAGIKGGKKAEVTAGTKNLILESASFNASYVRKASEKLGIRTDASKRFENKFSSSLAGKGMNDFSAYLFNMDKNLAAGEIFDGYPNPLVEKKISISPESISNTLGVSLSAEVIEKILVSLLIKIEKQGSEWVLTPPLFRADLTIPQDIAEEVGRIYGYNKIPAVLPPKPETAVEIPKSFYYEWKIREILTTAGFSEVMTSSFSDKGVTAIEKPLAEDKKYARVNVRDSFEKALKMDSLNAPLLGIDETRIFEIGRVFTKEGEQTLLAIGFAGPKKKILAELSATVALVSEKLGLSLVGETKDGVFECRLDDVFAKLPESKVWDVTVPSVKNTTYQQFSLYPFIVRDVAVFVSPETTPESVAQIIRDNAGELVVRGPELFDEFTKEGKKSVAFRTVFQSFDRTLSDEEIHTVMEKVTVALTAQGWQVR